MKHKLLLTILLLLPAAFCLAQSGSDNNNAAYQVIQGDGVYEGGMMYILEKLKDFIWEDCTMFITDAKALSANYMIIFFAIKSYEMMSGDKKLEIMPLLRPFGLTMILIWWSAFVKVVEFPTQVVAVKTKSYFDRAQKNADNLRLQRAELMKVMADSLYNFQARTEVAAKESDTWYGQAWDQVTSTVKSGISTVVAPILELKQRLQISMQLLMTQLLELGAIWILRIAVYVVFLIQIIYSTILVILGPFAVAASILPAFRDSFTTWIARFISVNLYTGIAYLILFICAQVQQFAMLSEISKYQEILKDNSAGGMVAKLTVFAGNGILSFGTVIVAFLISAIAMFTVPSISTWIVSTSGISSAASNFGRGAGTVWSTAKKVGTKLL